MSSPLFGRGPFFGDAYVLRRRLRAQLYKLRGASALGGRLAKNRATWLLGGGTGLLAVAAASHGAPEDVPLVR